MQREAPSSSPNRLEELIAQKQANDGGRKELVHLAAHCDVDQSTAWRWMKGKSAIPDDKKPLVAQRYGVTVAYLMRWDEPSPDPTLPSAA